MGLIGAAEGEGAIKTAASEDLGWSSEVLPHPRSAQTPAISKGA